MSDDDRIRHLLEEAVADVEPRPALDALRERTRPARDRRGWAWAVGGTVLATAATVAVVASLTSSPGTTGTGPHPPAATQPTAPTTGGTGGPSTVTAWFAVRTAGGTLLAPEVYPADGPVRLEDAMSRSVTGAADDPDYGTLWPSGSAVTSVRPEEDALVVDLTGVPTGRPAGMSRRDAETALDQLIRTADGAAHSTLPVQFLVDGQPGELLGLDATSPVPGSSDEDVSPVLVDSPQDGADVTSPFTVSGRASAFEANVQWELKQGDRVVERGFGTAEECCSLSPYSFRVSAAPGDYTLVVHDEDPSDGEGPGPVTETKRVTVR